MNKEFSESLRQAIRKELVRQQIKLVILDDDPTGIQTVHSCLLLTDWTEESLKKAFEHPEPFFYLLTNTRAMTRDEAEAVTRQAMEAVLEANQGFRLIFISRSDSTLRGHFPLETDVMCQVLQEQGIDVFPCQFLIPAFIEADRLTRQGVQYMISDGKAIPVAETEFARDNVFAYHHSDLKGYIEEKTGLENFRYISLGEGNFQSLSEEERRDWLESLWKRREFAAVSPYPFLGTSLLDVEDTVPTFVTLDVGQYADLQRFALALLQASANFPGAIVIRSSSSLPMAMSGIEPQELLSKSDFMGAHGAQSDDSFPGLFVVGSHVRKTTEQLEQLLQCEGTIGIDVDVEAILSSPGDLLKKILEEVCNTARKGQTPVLFTSRREIRLDDPEARQHLGQTVSDFLVSVVRHLPYRPAYLIGKGGITSHDLLTKGLQVKTATVMGQILKGVPCICTPDKLPYVIFPGNVGDLNALADIYLKLK